MSTTEKAMQAFVFQGEAVRFVGTADAPEWVAADVCAVLGIEKVSNALADFEADEKGARTVGTLGGAQELLTVTEPGLYRLVFRSRKPDAVRFRRWVTHEVLPAIRRTGSYGSPSALAAVEARVAALEAKAAPKPKAKALPSPKPRPARPRPGPEALAELLTAWAAHYGDRPVYARELAGLAQQREHAEAKAARLAKALGAFGESAREVGIALRGVVGARAGGVALERLGPDRNGIALWRAIFGAAAEVAVEAFQATPAGPLFVDRASRN